MGKKGILITIAIVAVAALAVIIAEAAIGYSSATSAAERCMSELDYEGAIAEYERVIDEDPENVMAYAGLIKACEAVGDPYRAEEVRRKAFRFTGDERFSEALITESEDRTPGGVSIGRGGVSIGDERQEEEEAAPVAVQETTKAPAVTSAPKTTTA
ncbi:MAG: tetratricopeptide repeat protein, partial [Ruminiclostridium sp.]